MPKAITSATLVYQGGLANVFAHHPKRRVVQGSFVQCEWYMRGLQDAGVTVDVAWCNEAGDIADRKWTHGLAAARDHGQAPFPESYHFKPSHGAC